MSRHAKMTFAMAAVVLAGMLAGTATRGQDASLVDQIRGAYKLAKIGMDANGWSVVEQGTVLVIQKGGILGSMPNYPSVAPAVFKDGELHGPNAFTIGLAGPNSRQLPVGEKVYVFKLDINVKGDKIVFSIIECDACNGAQQPSSYKSAIVFQFPKGYLASADAGQVRDVIASVLGPADDQGGGNGGGGGGGAQQQGGGGGNQQQAQPATIEPGQTIDQVVGAMGQPEKIVNLGKKQIYLYKDLKITFVDGKVSDVQ
jgi:hypothetical protein